MPDSQITPVPRDRKGGFQKGKSGNPGGRPKAVKVIQDLARKHTKKAVQALVDALKDDKLKVSAAQALLDRGYGKPAQAITGPQGEPLALSIQIDLSGGQNAK